MLAKSRSGNYSKLSFSIILPVAVFLLLSFSYFDSNELTNAQTLNPQKQSELIGEKKIGKIAWEGNAKYSDSQLNQVLGLKNGDLFTQEILENRLRQADDGILSLYMDKGYLFFNVEFSTKETTGGFFDLTIKIYEGNLAKIGEIRVKGNGDVPTKDVLDRIKFKQGDLFSRKDIILSIRSIADMNKFDPEKIMPRPIPNGLDSTGKFAIVDIEFQVTKK